MTDSMYEKGLEIRREVLGAEYVDKAVANATDFNEPMQELVTGYCWGEIWAREGLSRKTRSMLNLAMLSALNREHEFKLHVRGAINNGVSREEITEVLLQVAIYCGVPAAISAFRAAGAILKEMDEKR
jgi:4-carboxymuconolactone decarboxylase